MVCPPVRSIIHLLKFMDLLSVQAHKHALSLTAVSGLKITQKPVCFSVVIKYEPVYGKFCACDSFMFG